MECGEPAPAGPLSKARHGESVRRRAQTCLRTPRFVFTFHAVALCESGFVVTLER
jgi:hypothetical protein